MILKLNENDIEKCDCIFIQAPGFNKGILIGENKPLNRYKKKLFNLPFNLPKANYTNICTAFKKLTNAFFEIDDDNIQKWISPNKNFVLFLNKYYQQFKNIISYIEKRNNNLLEYNDIKNLPMDLDKFLKLVYNPGYCSWKYISKSCHNLTKLTLSFTVQLTVLKSFFINNPFLEKVYIQDIKFKLRSTSTPSTKWDKKLLEKEEKNNLETFPILTHLKSLTLYSSYTYRIWFNIISFNSWLKQHPNLYELKLFIREPLPKYYYNIYHIYKDCYSIENLIVSGPWFSTKCINTLINNEKNNPTKHHLKSLTISLSDDVEPKHVKELINCTSMEKLELNIHPNFDIKKLYNKQTNFDYSKIKSNESTFHLYDDDLRMIKSLP